MNVAPIIWTLIFYIFCSVVAIQLFYYLYFFIRLAFHKQVTPTEEMEHAVSVVICARDEAHNLVQTMPAVLVQDYKSSFEIVLVNDNSTDDTKYLIDEFKKAFKKWMIESQHLHEKEPVYEDEDEEEAEGDEEDMTYGQRLFQAVILLFIGTLICTLVSDPMVDVIGGIGKKMNISAFYISFVVTPLASNASEVISCLIFASKKTKTSISLTLATLHGAAIMNNTLALSIFMALIYFRKLSWDFGAEVISLLVVIIVVGINALRNSIFMWQATIVFMMYPLLKVIFRCVFKILSSIL